MWSPKANKNGARNPFYDFMTEVSVGDVIFSYAKTRISFIGIATGVAHSSNKPNDFDDNKYWDDDGWLVPVEFYELSNPIKPKDHILRISPLLPTKYSPLQANGKGNELYLTEVSLELAKELSNLLKGEVDEIAIKHTSQGSISVLVNKAETRAIREIEQRKDIKETEKLRLVKSRNGQGVYKDRLIAIESGCRITGLTDTNFLIASHIKPWVKSNDFEKLDGNNGLLLSPHVDKLFDAGYISFSNDGDMLISSGLNTDILKLWRIDYPLNISRLNTQQQGYMKYHRKNIFKP